MKSSESRIESVYKTKLVDLLVDIFILDKGDRFVELGELLEFLDNKYGEGTADDLLNSEDIAEIICFGEMMHGEE